MTLTYADFNFGYFKLSRRFFDNTIYLNTRILSKRGGSLDSDEGVVLT